MCERCGLRMTWPQPSTSVLDEAYDDASYYSAHGMHDVDFGTTKARVEELLLQVGRDVRRVLDFGAGEGHLVAAFRSLGIEADGVEPSGAARAEARRRYEVELLPTIPPENQRYDLIALVHSLEHVREPVSVMRSLRSRLNPHGSVFIDVPNAESFEILRPSRRKSILELPLHLYHFTPTTLSAVLRAVGLEVTNVRLMNPEWLEWLLSRWAARLSSATRDVRLVVGRSSVQEKQSRVPMGRRAWRERVLPFIRGHSPGWRFEVFAEPASNRK
jgi:SAM-dependent methyltransferase